MELQVTLSGGEAEKEQGNDDWQGASEITIETFYVDSCTLKRKAGKIAINELIEA